MSYSNAKSLHFITCIFVCQYKKVKVNTKQISFDLYQSGKSVKEIASDRSLATTTIEGHLAHFIEEGVLKLSDFLSDEKYQTILLV